MNISAAMFLIGISLKLERFADKIAVCARTSYTHHFNPPPGGGVGGRML